MLYTLEAVKANIRNRDGKRVFFLGKGDQLTWEARDFLNGEKISILPAEQAKIERYRLISGGFLEEKPEHMTHLHGDVLVRKTHPRIRFRGAMDTLEAEILLSMVDAQGETRQQLQEVLEHNGALEFFGVIVGSDVVKEYKPDPEGLLLAMEQMRVSPGQVLYCGDTLIDAQTAQRAGVDFCAVLNGTTTEQEFLSVPHVHIARDLMELSRWLGV